MSAIDWTPGPLLRGMMDGGADVVMRRVRDGVWRVDIEHRGRHGNAFVDSAYHETAQAAADAIEDMLRVRGMGGA